MSKGPRGEKRPGAGANSPQPGKGGSYKKRERA
jgi:hypothetical protein